MAKVKFTPHAEAGLYDVWATIALDNERAADGVFNRIMRKVKLAAEQPLMGSPRPELSPAARVLVEGAYLVIYEPDAEGVLVIAVVHGMREPSSWL